jgi:hypothetical protein
MFRLVTSLTTDGKLTAILFNNRGIAVADLQEPVSSAEEALVAARSFFEDHPDLFDDHALVDVSAETQRMHPELFEDGGLIPVPENLERHIDEHS